VQNQCKYALFKQSVHRFIYVSVLFLNVTSI